MVHGASKTGLAPAGSPALRQPSGLTSVRKRPVALTACSTVRAPAQPLFRAMSGSPSAWAGASAAAGAGGGGSGGRPGGEWLRGAAWAAPRLSGS